MSAESSFGMIAKNRRRELGLTQDELAKRVGCAPITLRKIEADDLRPSVQIAERMAMALNIPLEERAAFVKLARIDRTPVEEPKVTPMPAFDEIGSEDLSGRAIRGYALGERLGNGGMGVVYRAVQPLVEREVAIKIILPQYANHPDFIRRFEAEAQLVARLEHPHIVPLYDYWREPSVAYLIMRLLRGGSVQSLLRNGTVLTPETVLRMMEQIGSALSSAHRAGVVHRDLKPANVLLDEDNNAYLADFGIAKNLSSPSSDTQADMVIGSPDYISPEQIKAEFVRPQTDIYALGVMLYELLTGKVPFHGPTPFEVMHQHLSTPLPSLAANRSGLPKALDAVIEHATEKDPLQRYETVDMLLDDLRKALSLNLHEIKSNAVTSQPTAVPLTAIDNPYKGLRAFGEGDAQDFYGREALTQQLLVRLGEGGELARFLAVVGPSGSGKSSVVKAGLIPALRRGALPGSENWFILEMLPGSHPLEELEAALLRVAVNPPASLIEQFQKDSRGLIRAVRRSLPNDPNIELVLVIDQFEEVFTLLQDETERLHFLGLLVSAILDENSRVRVVLTLRADFIDRPLNYVDFGELLHQRVELVLPLTPDELENAIVAPAERVGLCFEAGLVSAILHDLGDQPGTLPLLQYALTELYEKRAGNTLTKSAYREIGGVLGALGRRAEEIFTGLDSESQTIAKQLFLRLVTLGEGVEDTRRRALIAELENLQLDNAIDAKNYSKSFQKVLDSFGHARLLSFDRDPDTRGPTLEVAHEAIIREWTRLRDWLNESRALVRMQRQLAHAAAEWEDAHRDHSFLLTGTKLAQYEGWTISSAIALTQHELAYLKASITEEQRIEAKEIARQQHELETAQKLAETERARAEEQTHSVKRLRRSAVFLVSALALTLIAALVAGIYSNRNAALAKQNANIASTAHAAENKAIDEANARATAQANAQALFTRADAQRLAAEANTLLNSNGSSDLIALLSLQSLKIQYTPQGDTALSSATFLNYPRKSFIGHTGLIWELVISKDGRYAFSGSDDKTARLWDTQTGKELISYKHEGPVSGVGLSPDNQYAVTITDFSIINLWDAKTGKLIFSQNTNARYATFSEDGKYFYIGTNNGAIQRWEIQTLKTDEKFSLNAPDEVVMQVTPDGKYAITTNLIGPNSTVKLWELGDPVTKINTFDFEDVSYAVALSPDYRYLLAGYDGGDIVLWDVATGKNIHTYKGHVGQITNVSFSKDEKKIITSGNDGTTRVWDVLSGNELLRLKVNSAYNYALFSPDESSILTGYYNGIIQQWDANSQSELPVFLGNINDPSRHTYLGGIDFSSDGKLLATSGGNGLQLWDIESRELKHAYPTAITTYELSFSPDNHYLLSGGFYSGIVSLWDIDTGEEKFKITTRPYELNSESYASDGKSIALVRLDNMQVWDIQTEKKTINVSNGWDNEFTRVRFSPDGQSILTADTGGKILLWDFQTGKLLKKLDGFSYINDANFSPDGKYIVTATDDKMAHLWDIETGKEIRHYIGHTDWVSSATFSPDGYTIATGSADDIVRLWDVQTGQEIRRYAGHQAAVNGVAFSPDGKYLATVSNDGTARLWDVGYHTTIEYLCSILLRDFTDEERAQYGITDTTPTCPQP